jgi:protein-disulfide isomerase
MYRVLPKGLIILGVLAGFLGAARATNLEAMAADRVLGKADAPVTIIEYASLTCPHCAAFHKDVLPQLKAKYIDTGKVKLVFRDFPLDGRATLAAMVARCARPERYFGFLDALFRSQAQWGRAEDPKKALAQVARIGGMGDAEFDACMKNEALLHSINKSRADGESQFKVNSTPTFIINGKKEESARDLASFEKILQPLVK